MSAAAEQPPAGILVGYARVSTEDQDLALQIDALLKAGVPEGRIYREHASGAAEDRPAFIAAVKALRAGDTLVVWKIDRLGRRLGRLIQTVEHIKTKGASVRVLTEPFDTETPTGSGWRPIETAPDGAARLWLRDLERPDPDRPGGRISARPGAADPAAVRPGATPRVDGRQCAWVGRFRLPRRNWDNRPKQRRGGLPHLPRRAHRPGDACSGDSCIFPAR